jgi:hypothetical protein
MSPVAVKGISTMLPLSGETDDSVWILQCEYDEQLGPEIVKEICSACFEWEYSSGAEWVTSATLLNVVADINFKKIIDLHFRVKESGDPTLFPNYLVRLTRCTSHYSFLILYTFITGETPSSFARCRVGNIPAPKLAGLMKEKGLCLNLMPVVLDKHSSWLDQSLEKQTCAGYEIQSVIDLDSSEEQPVTSESSE